MAFESDLIALLRTICPRARADFLPPDTARPYVTYQQIGGQVVVPLDSSAPGVENAEVQINVWADSRAEAKTMIKQIAAALIASTAMKARPLGASVSDFDSDIPVFGSRQDFTIWAAP